MPTAPSYSPSVGVALEEPMYEEEPELELTPPENQIPSTEQPQEKQEESHRFRSSLLNLS
jgi:hypothetical protein